MSLYQASVPQLKKMLNNADKWLEAAVEHAKSKSFDPNILASARLSPDQYPLTGQIQAIAFKDPGTTVAVAVARGTGKKEFTVRISAIPNDAEEVAAAPVEKKKPATPNTNRLGITVEPLSAITVRQLGLPNSTKGLLVRSINHGSPAEGKLFSADRDPRADVITEVEGKSVRTEDDLKAALANARNGVVTLMVLNPSSGGITRIERVRVIAK